ncbi:MAG: hypothetical protein RR645_04025 [Clostridium sp.]
MRYREWILLLLTAALGIMAANYIGFDVPFIESLPGVLIFAGISLVGIFISKLLPINLPVIAYVSIVGLLLASPISPIADYVIAASMKINFTAPLTLVGAFAGISIGNELKRFATQGWKMIIIAILVMTGTYIGSAAVSNIILSLTNAI